MRNSTTFRRKVSGFTMLEVLISIVVIAFGLLGIAGLQAFSLKNNQSATYRTIATALAYDMIDRMKANPIAADAGSYNAPTAGDYPTAGVGSCLLVAGCSTAELASNDLYEWSLLVAGSLPGGTAVVCRDQSPNDGTSVAAPACNPGSNSQYAIKIWWVDDRTASAIPGRFTTHFEQ